MKQIRISQWSTAPIFLQRHHKGTRKLNPGICFLRSSLCLPFLFLSVLSNYVFPSALAAPGLPTLSSTSSDHTNLGTTNRQPQLQTRHEELHLPEAASRAQQDLDLGAERERDTWRGREQGTQHSTRNQGDLQRVGNLQHNLHQVPSLVDTQTSLLQLVGNESPAVPAPAEISDRPVDHQQQHQRPQTSRELQQHEDKEGVHLQEQQQAQREGVAWTSPEAQVVVPPEKKEEPGAETQATGAAPIAHPLASAEQIKPAIVVEPVKYSFAADSSASPSLSLRATSDSPPLPTVAANPPLPSATATGPPLPQAAATAPSSTVDVDGASADTRAASPSAASASADNKETSPARAAPPVTSTTAAAATGGPFVPPEVTSSSAVPPTGLASEKSISAASHVASAVAADEGRSGISADRVAAVKQASTQEEQQSKHQEEAQQMQQPQQVKQPQGQRERTGEIQRYVQGDKLQQQQQPEELEPDKAAQISAAPEREGENVPAAKDVPTSSSSVHSPSAEAGAATNLSPAKGAATAGAGDRTPVEHALAEAAAAGARTSSEAPAAVHASPEVATKGVEKPTTPEATAGSGRKTAGGRSPVVAGTSTAADSSSLPAGGPFSPVAADGSAAVPARTSAAGGSTTPPTVDSPAAAVAARDAAVYSSAAAAADGRPATEPTEETEAATAAAGGEEGDAATAAAGGEEGDAAAAADATAAANLDLTAAEEDSARAGQQTSASEAAAAPALPSDTSAVDGGAQNTSCASHVDASSGRDEDQHLKRDSGGEDNGGEEQETKKQQQQDALTSARVSAREAGLLHQHSLFLLLLLLLGLFVFGGLSAAGGIGGGSVFVALLVGLGRVPVCYAIPISKVMVFSSSCSSVWSQRFLERQGTLNSSPAVARDWVNLLVPMALSGTLVGVLLNTVAPAAYLLLLLALLLLLLSSRTIFTAYKMYKEEEALRGEPAFDDLLLPRSAAGAAAACPAVATPAAAYPSAAAGASQYMVSHCPAASAAFPAFLPLPAFDAASRDYRQQQHQRVDALAASRQQLPLPVFTRSAVHMASPPASEHLAAGAAGAGVDEAGGGEVAGGAETRAVVEEEAAPAGETALERTTAVGDAAAEATEATATAASGGGEAVIPAGKRISTVTAPFQAAAGGAPAVGAALSTAAAGTLWLAEEAVAAAVAEGREQHQGAERSAATSAADTGVWQQQQCKASTRHAAPAATAAEAAESDGKLSRRTESAARTVAAAPERNKVEEEEGKEEKGRGNRGAVSGGGGEGSEAGQCGRETREHQDGRQLPPPAAGEGRLDSAACGEIEHLAVGFKQDVAAVGNRDAPAAAAAVAAAADARVSGAENRNAAASGKRRAAADGAAASESARAAERGGGGGAAEGGRAAAESERTATGGERAPIAGDAAAARAREFRLGRKGSSAGVDLLGYFEEDEQQQLQALQQRQQVVEETPVDLVGGCGDPQQLREDVDARATAAREETAAGFRPVTRTAVAAAGRETEDVCRPAGTSSAAGAAERQTEADARSPLSNLLDQAPLAESSSVPRGGLAYSLAAIDFHGSEPREKQLQHGEQLKPQGQLQEQQQEMTGRLYQEKEKQLEQEKEEKLRAEEEDGTEQKQAKLSRVAAGGLQKKRYEEAQSERDFREKQQQQQRESLQEQHGLRKEKKQDEGQYAGVATSEQQEQQCTGKEKRGGTDRERTPEPEEVKGSLHQVRETERRQQEGREEGRRTLQELQQNETQQQEARRKPQQLQEEEEVKEKPRQERTGKQQRQQRERKEQQQVKQQQQEQLVSKSSLLNSLSPPPDLQSSSTKYCARRCSSGEPIAGVPLSPSSACGSSFPLFYNLEDDEDLSHISVCLTGGPDGEELLAQQTQQEQQRLLQEFEKTAARGIRQLLPQQPQTGKGRSDAVGEVCGVAVGGGRLYSSRSSGRQQQPASSREGSPASIASRLLRVGRCGDAAAATGPRWLGSSSDETAAETAGFYDREATGNMGPHQLRGETCLQKSNPSFFLNPTHAQPHASFAGKLHQQQQSGSTTAMGMGGAAQRLLSCSAGAAHRLAGIYGPTNCAAAASSQRAAVAGAYQELPLLAGGAAAAGASSGKAAFSAFPTAAVAAGLSATASSPQWGGEEQQSAAASPCVCVARVLRSCSSVCAGTFLMQKLCGLLQQLREHLRVADGVLFQPPTSQPHYFSLLLLMLVNVFCSVLLHGFLSTDKRRAAACAALAAVAAGAYVQLRFTLATLRGWGLTQQPQGRMGLLPRVKKAGQRLWRYTVAAAVAAAAAAAAVAVRGWRAAAARFHARESARSHPGVRLAEQQQQTLLQQSAADDFPDLSRRRNAAAARDSCYDFHVARSPREGMQAGARGIAASAAAPGKNNAPFAVELPLVNCSAAATSTSRASRSAAGEEVGAARRDRVALQKSVAARSPAANLNPFSPPQSPTVCSSPVSFYDRSAASPHGADPSRATEAATADASCAQPTAAGAAVPSASRCGSSPQQPSELSSAAAASRDAGEGTPRGWGLQSRSTCRSSTSSSSTGPVGAECFRCSSSSSGSLAAVATLPASSNAVLLLTPFVGFFTGIFAGLIGVGGGVLFSPFLLLLGEDPVVAVATASACVVFTSAATSLQFLLIGRLPVLHALLFGAVAAVAAATATCGMQRIRRACGGRKSLVAGCVAAAVSLGSLLILWRCAEVWVHGEV